MKKRWLTYRLIIVLLCGICSRGGTLALFAQTEGDSIPHPSTYTEMSRAIADSVLVDSIIKQNEKNLQQLTQEADTAKSVIVITDTPKTTEQPKPTWVPNPQRALWLGLVFPGGGQIYNRKYWKLPIFYGGIIGCVYALKWNGQMYNDYSQAYLDFMDDDPSTDSYLDMLSQNYRNNVSANADAIEKQLKRKKDFYRRYRDLSVFVMIGVYLLSVVDAYVDAELSVFDISKDLSLKVEPAVINSGYGTRIKDNAVGLQCHLNF